MIISLLTTWEDLLGKQIQSLEQLTEMLQEEREAIVTFDVPLLAGIARRKETLLTAIQSIESSRTVVLQQLAIVVKLSPTASCHAVVAQLPDRVWAARLADRLSCLKSLAQAVMELNDSQRRFLARSLVNVEQSLSMIQSLQGASVGSYYNKDGVMGAGLVGRAQTMNQSV